jgi:hypothetical protein
MHRIKAWLLRENTLVFFFCLAAISGPAMATVFAFDISQAPDCNSYMGLANLDFHQTAVRRFRVIVPFAAGGLNYLLGGVLNKLAPVYFKGDFGLPFSFFIVNSLLTAYFGLLIYRYCKAYGVGVYMALLGTLVMLTCRYTAYIAGLPMVDSLFCVVVAMSLLGIKERNTSILVWAIFLGPFAKESFIFIAPIIFFFSHIPKRKLFIYFLLSGILVFSYRYVYELYAPPTIVSGLAADLYHLNNLVREIPHLLSFKGFYKLASNPGLWAMIPVLALLFCKGFWTRFCEQAGAYMLWFMISVMVQVLLSGSFERMFYISMPFWAVLIAISSNELKKLYMSKEK